MTFSLLLRGCEAFDTPFVTHDNPYGICYFQGGEPESIITPTLFARELLPFSRRQHAQYHGSSIAASVSPDSLFFIL
jgi:hypothetical protein